MEKLALFVTIFCLCHGLLFSQVAINPDGSPPHPSAGLDVNFSNKGLLPPRMTKTELNNILSPAEGLIVYCTDCGTNGSGAIAIFMAGAWRSVFVNDCLNLLPAPAGSTHDASSGQIIWNWQAVTGAVGYRWSATNNVDLAEDLGAVLTKTQTGLTCNTGYTSYIWAYNLCGNSTETMLTKSTSIDPAPPAAGSHVPSSTQIIWNWDAISGATGYKWNTTNNFEGGEDLGNVLSKTESGLECDSAYTRYVWSYNTCGHSTASTLTQSTLQIQFTTSPAEGSHSATGSTIEWKWHPVDGATGYKWNTANDYGSAYQMGTDTIKLETGLGCNSNLTSYAWAYDNCGASTPTAMTMSTTSQIPAVPAAGTHVATAVQITWNWNTASGAMGYRWGTTDNFDNATEMGSATSKVEPALNCNTPYTRYIWAYNDCGHSASNILTKSTTNNLPATPTAGTHIPSYSQIIWHWNTASDAGGYKWNTTNDYNSAMDMGVNTSKTETNLTCESNYTRYVWAYNSCGVSSPVTLTQSTLSCWTCGNPFTKNHVAGNVCPVTKTVTYGTVTNIPGETGHCWITSNLGSDHQATSKTDTTEASAGWYWQFNRMQGYKFNGGGRTPNTTWIPEINEYSTWTAANDPCTLELGAGWRVPTATEWDNVDVAGNWTNYNGPWNSALKMHEAGRLNNGTGILEDRGSKGYYWSSTQTGTTTYAQCLYFNSSSCSVSQYPKACGMSIRCLKD